MWSTNLILLLLAAWASAFDMKELHEFLLADKDFMAAKDTCMKKLGLAPGELVLEKHSDNGQPSEKFMCFGKCVQEEQGYLDADGNVVIDPVKNLPIFGFIPEDQKAQVLECLEKLDAIKECKDVKKQKECFHKFIQ